MSLPTLVEPSSRPLKLMIADPAWLVRDGFARLLAEISPAASICNAPSGGILHRMLCDNRDIAAIFVGKDMIVDEEESLLVHIRKLVPEAVIAVIGDGFDRDSVRKAERYGALAVIGTAQPREDVSAALRKVLAERKILPPPPDDGAPPLPSPRRNPAFAVLTERERDIFARLGEGLSVPLIAERLKLSPHTIRVHITRLMKKLDIHDRAALMHRAVSSSLDFQWNAR